MDEAFILMMKEFIAASIKDRDASKEDREKNRDCFMDIKIQLTSLQTQNSLNLKTNEERHQENNIQHKNIEKKLESIPTDNDKTTYEKRFDELEKLKPMVYKITGGLILIAIIGIPFAKKMGWI